MNRISYIFSPKNLDKNALRNNLLKLCSRYDVIPNSFSWARKAIWYSVNAYRICDFPLQRSARLSLALLQKSRRHNYQGHPTSIFGKYLFGRRFEIQSFRNICCKISCLPASPRIFEHLKKGIIAHFKRIFTLKTSLIIFADFREPFLWLKFSKR